MHGTGGSETGTRLVSFADSAPRTNQQFKHTALIVHSDEMLRERLMPALNRALDAGETILMVVKAHTEHVVRCPITCIWDSRHHPTLVMEGIRSLHDHELSATGPVPNPDFIQPTEYLSRRNKVAFEPPPPITDLDLNLLDKQDLTPLRTELTEWTRDRGFAHFAATDVLIATSEVATNGLVHGSAPVRIRCWHHTDTLIVQVDDAGGTPIPPTAGYQPPGDQPGGRGMWLARQLADTVTTYTTSAFTTVRLHFPHDVTHLNPASE